MERKCKNCGNCDYRVDEECCHPENDGSKDWELYYDEEYDVDCMYWRPITQFKVGESYRDYDDEPWEVMQIFYVKGQPCLLVKGTGEIWKGRYHPALVRGNGTDATILMDDRVVSLYSERKV